MPARNHRTAFGLKILNASHPGVRQLKRDGAVAEIHGNKFWNSSYLIMDYLKKNPLPKRSRVLEVGCGWGLLGLYCAKKFGNRAHGIDADKNVLSYLDLHADINEVRMTREAKTFNQLTTDYLRDFDVILGADICFWDEMIDPVYKLIKKAMKVGVGQVIVADPGRPPFHALSKKVIKKFGGEVKEWEIKDEIKAEAYLLIAGSLP